MNRLIVANWKKNPKSLEEAKVLAMSEDRENVVICPPVIFLPEIKLSNAKLGAQDIEIPILELKHLGVEYIILGHSQRRLNVGETDEVINNKVKETLNHQITAILCLGKNIDEQFTNCTKGLALEDLKKIIFVYEPLGAISTVKNSKPISSEIANEMIERIHKLAGLESVVLYGGTVNKDDATRYAQYSSIDGALVGAASLDPDNFLKVYDIFRR